MLIVALVLAVIGLAALVTAVVTSNELVAWVCIAASVLGVILLIVDAIRERQHRDDEESEAAGVAAVEPDSIAYSADETPDSAYSNFDAEYPENAADEGHAGAHFQPIGGDGHAHRLPRRDQVLQGIRRFVESKHLRRSRR